MSVFKTGKLTFIDYNTASLEASIVKHFKGSSCCWSLCIQVVTVDQANWEIMLSFLNKEALTWTYPIICGNQVKEFATNFCFCWSSKPKLTLQSRSPSHWCHHSLIKLPKYVPTPTSSRSLAQIIYWFVITPSQRSHVLIWIFLVTLKVQRKYYNVLKQVL